MEGKSIKSFENLCKIFEMRIELDKEKKKDTNEEVLVNYEKYSKKIDSIYNSEFERDIKPLITPELTIEAEQKRLKKLIKLLEDRLEKRKELEDKFYETTGNYIKGLQMIVSDYELNEKKERLNLITKYLDTTKEIESINESVSNLRKSLIEEEDKKEAYISKNKILEDELYSTFVSIIKEDNDYKDINEDEINKEIDTLVDSVREAKETLDITKESVSSLKINGLEEDYSSYIEDAEKNYYILKNKELILRIYNLVVKFEEEFNDIYRKRNEIKELLEEKNEIKGKLNIDDIDNLLQFENLLYEQIKTLNIEKEILENISNYTSRINFKEERLSELEKENNSIEILSILREYGIIDTYDTEEVSLEEMVLSDEEPIVKEVIDPYRIVEIKDYPRTLNIGLAKLKGEAIREKVNKKLNPIVEDKKVEEITSLPSKELPKEPPVEDILPKEEDININSKVNEPIINTPVWEVPSFTSVNTVNEAPKEEEKNSPPVWQPPMFTNTNTTEEVKKEEIPPMWNINTIDIMPNIEITSEKTETSNEQEQITNDNMFWVPVSDQKLSANEFPSINIPIQNNYTSGKDNFGFPDIN